MPKTDMTRAIEQAILAYHPAEYSGLKVNKHRYEHTALEVPVECGTTIGGIIDAVRVSEYFGDIKSRNVCKPAIWRRDGIRGGFDCIKGCDMHGKLEVLCDEKQCRWNSEEKRGIPKILVTCFEIKVSRNDFKSAHGHNHVGNLNYYAIPKELYPQVQDLIPEGIGVLLYLHEGVYTGLRVKLRSDYKEVSDENQKWMILSVLKRIRDTEYQKYQEQLQRARRGVDFMF